MFLSATLFIQKIDLVKEGVVWEQSDETSSQMPSSDSDNLG